MTRAFTIRFVRRWTAVSIACLAFGLPASSQQDVRYSLVQTGHGPLTLAARDQGRGRTLLLLHGLGSTSTTWNAIAPSLAAHYRVIALDLRGFGESQKPEDEFYSVADQANAVQAFIEKENLTDITLIGHSFGGGVALTLALNDAASPRPRVKSMVLIDTIAYRQPMPIFFRALQVPLLGPLGLSLIPAQVQAAQALRLAYFDQSKVTDQLVEEYAQPLREAPVRHAFMETVNHLIPDDIDGVADRYRSLNLPVQIIWGTGDRIVPVVLGKRLSYNILHARFAEFSECGHLPQEEKPEQTLKVIEDFLLSTAGRSIK